jgi:hypothetical protein
MGVSVETFAMLKVYAQDSLGVSQGQCCRLACQWAAKLGIL